MKVVLVCAVTIDGKIARHSQERVTWNSEGDNHFFCQRGKAASGCYHGAEDLRSASGGVERGKVVCGIEPPRMPTRCAEGAD